jgi:hypothetical protein
LFGSIDILHPMVLVTPNCTAALVVAGNAIWADSADLNAAGLSLRFASL